MNQNVECVPPVTVISRNLSYTATQDDRKLFTTLHPAGARLLTYVAERWDVKRIPKIGVIVSDPDLIREIYMNKQAYSKVGEGASSSFWNPIIGNTGLLNMTGIDHLTLKRSLAGVFNPKNVNSMIATKLTPILDRMETELLAGHPVDIVETVASFVYEVLWDLIGFPVSVVSKYATTETVHQLRSVTHGLKPSSKKLSPKQVTTALQKLAFIDTLTKETLKNSDNIPPNTIISAMRKDNYTSTEIVSLLKSLMIVGTETVISFTPRMAALFIKTGYLNTQHATTNLQDGIEEALRITVPTPVAARSVTQNITIAGVPVKAGERIILNTLSACQKQGIFNPGNPVNKNVKGLWFGAGVHMCIGLPVALQEAELFAQKLYTINMQKPLQIVTLTINRNGHTGSYKKLIIQCQTS